MPLTGAGKGRVAVRHKKWGGIGKIGVKSHKECSRKRKEGGLLGTKIMEGNCNVELSFGFVGANSVGC